MSFSNTPAVAGPLPPGRYLVQLLARNDPPPSGRFAVERVACRNVDDPVHAEFAICAHIDLLNRELRTNDRVHVVQRYRGAVRNLLRRVEVRGDSLLLYPMRRARGPKAKPLNAADVVVMGVVTGALTQFRVNAGRGAVSNLALAPRLLELTRQPRDCRTHPRTLAALERR